MSGVVVLCVMSGATVAADTNLRFADVIAVEGSELAATDGMLLDLLALVACHHQACAPIPFQIDERDAEGRWVLDQGPLPTVDTPPGVLDANDILLFMADDVGQRQAPHRLPGDGRAVEIAVADGLDGSTGWVYLVAFSTTAPRAPASYVRYDPSADRLHGSRVVLGFRDGVPGYLAIEAETGDSGNLLDQFKVRASATFLFGLFGFARDESDLTTERIAWREGPIRIIRSQRQWVRMAWGLRSPTFGSYTSFYRDSAELPLGLRLNFPPTYFFSNIVVRVILDFRDLRGWSLVVPGVPEPLPVDGAMTPQERALNELPETWFALQGPQLTLVQAMEVGPSLQSVRRRLLYRDDETTPDPPEFIPGSLPAVGYQLDRWQGVGAGTHELAASSFALPPDLDVRRFMASRQTPLAVSTTPVR